MNLRRAATTLAIGITGLSLAMDTVPAGAVAPSWQPGKPFPSLEAALVRPGR